MTFPSCVLCILCMILGSCDFVFVGGLLISAFGVAWCTSSSCSSNRFSDLQVKAFCVMNT